MHAPRVRGPTGPAQYQHATTRSSLAVELPSFPPDEESSSGMAGPALSRALVRHWQAASLPTSVPKQVAQEFLAPVGVDATAS